MAKVRYFKVEVTLNKMAKQTVSVPEWEVAVLLAQWGEDAQVIEDESSPFTRDLKLPSPADEFERLALRYGPKHSETPYVAGVFGNYGPGVNALADAMVRSTRARVVIEDEPTIDPNEIIAAAEREAEAEAKAAAEAGGEKPTVTAGGVTSAPEATTEGGDSEEDFADLAGDATEGAEAAA